MKAPSLPLGLLPDLLHHQFMASRHRLEFTGKIIAFIAVLVLAACSSAPAIDPGTAFAPVRTIELRDATDPLILASTSAGRVRDYFEIGLKHRGYSVCRDCTADAVATVTVLEYSTQLEMNRNLLSLGERNIFNLARIRLAFTVVRNGETIMRGRVRGERMMEIDQFAAREVQRVLEQIPVHK